MARKTGTGSNITRMARKKSKTRDVSKPVFLSTGTLALVVPISASLADEARRSVPSPEPPMVDLASKGRVEPNYNDPNYLAELQEVESKRGNAVIEAAIMFGVTLCDEDGNKVDVPDDGWKNKLRYLEKRGVLDLSEFDLDDEFDEEFLYKKFVAVATPDLELILSTAGVSEEDIQLAGESFQGSKA